MLKNKKISDLKTHNLTGLKIGKLTVIGISEFRNKHNRIMWDCICDCGNKKSIPADMLNKTLRGGTGSKSCGCLRNNAHNKIKDRLDACYRQIYNSTIVNWRLFSYNYYPADSERDNFYQVVYEKEVDDMDISNTTYTGTDR